MYNRSFSDIIQMKLSGALGPNFVRPDVHSRCKLVNTRWFVAMGWGAVVPTRQPITGKRGALMRCDV